MDPPGHPLPGGALSAHALHRRLRRGERSLRNHLRSIVADARFVAGVRSLPPAFELPLFANQRCGAWYAPDADGAAYFKSTDGHVGTWAFSSTRLNTHFAGAAAAAGGALLVDATKAGKRFPDALTRTVPLWAAVVNAVLGVDGGVDPASSGAVHVCAPSWMPPSERAQVEARAAAFASALPEGTRAAITVHLRDRVSAPLVPGWLCPRAPTAAAAAASGSTSRGTDGDGGGADVDYEFSVCDCVSRRRDISTGPAPLDVAAFLGGGASDPGGDCSDGGRRYIPLLCVSASRVVPDGGDATSAHAGWTYIQGAGDDAESWARGLSPSQLWGPDGAHVLLPLLRFSDGDYDAEGTDPADTATDANTALEAAVDALVALRRRQGLGADAAALAAAGDSDGGEPGSIDDEAAALLSALQLAPGLPRCCCVWLPPAPPPAPLTPSQLAALRRRATAGVADSSSGTRWHVLLLTPLLEDGNDDAGSPIAADGAGTPHPPPPPSNLTLLAVPADKRAARRADGGRVWQAALLPAVEAAVGCFFATAALEPGCRLAVVPATPELAPHGVPVAAVAAVHLQRLQQQSTNISGSSDTATLTPASAPADSAPAISIDKAGLRGLLAQLQAAAAVPSVPRELQQQLNAWFLSPR